MLCDFTFEIAPMRIIKDLLGIGGVVIGTLEPITRVNTISSEKKTP